MPRPVTTVRVPIDLAREIERLLHCTEMDPLLGRAATAARATLRDLAPGAFEKRGAGPTCAVCDGPIPIDRILAAATRGGTAIYDTDTCRNTAKMRKQRARADEKSPSNA